MTMPDNTNDNSEREVSATPEGEETTSSAQGASSWAERAAAQARKWEQRQADPADGGTAASSREDARGDAAPIPAPVAGTPGMTPNSAGVPAEPSGMASVLEENSAEPDDSSTATVPFQAGRPDDAEPSPAAPAPSEPEQPVSTVSYRARYGRNVPIAEPERDASGRIAQNQPSTWGYGPDAPRIEGSGRTSGEAFAGRPSAVDSQDTEPASAGFEPASTGFAPSATGFEPAPTGFTGVGPADASFDTRASGRLGADAWSDDRGAAGARAAVYPAGGYATAEPAPAMEPASDAEPAPAADLADGQSFDAPSAAGEPSEQGVHAYSKPAGASFSRADWKRPPTKRISDEAEDDEDVPRPKPSSVPGGDFPEFQEPVPGSRKDRAQKSLDRTRQKFGEKKESAKTFLTRKTPSRLKNPTELQVRLRTGVVYVSLSIILALISDATLVLLLCVLAGICAGEFFYILRSDDKLPNELLGIIASVAYPVCYWLWGMGGVIADTGIFLIALLVWYVFWQRARIVDVAVSFFGALYTGFLLSSLIIVRQGLGGFWGGMLVVGIFASVWINDGFAYLFGSRFGKHKMAPRISPKKSWEGFAAGLVGSVLTWCLMTLIPGLNMPMWMAVLFGLLCGLAGVLGDLAESRIKRNSGVKDSGTIMPGHGGLLDRSDSMFLAAAVACALLLLGGCIVYV